MRLRVVAAAVALLFSRAGDAAAEPERPLDEALLVEPNECFDAAALAPHVARWLERQAVDRRIQVEISGSLRTSPGVALTVRRDDAIVGGRTFPPFAEPCEEVRAAVGLAAALAIDATVLASLGVPLPPPPPSDEATPPEPEPKPRAWPGAGVSLDGAVLLGVLPVPSPALAPSDDLALTPFLGLRFSGLFTRAGSVPVGSATAEVTLFAGRIDACSVFVPRPLVVRGCAGLSVGRLQAAGVGGVRPTYTPEALWLAGAARLEARIPLASWFQIGVAADAFVPFTRASLDVDARNGSVLASRGLAPLGAAFGAGPVIVLR
jgi:hypothetical protein